MAINNANVTTIASSIYTSAASSAITTIHLCNYTATAVQANLWLVPSGKTANNFSLIYANTTISGYNTLIVYQEKFILSTGDAVYANCSANVSLSATVSSIGI
jgi:hypothetical protein